MRGRGVLFAAFLLCGSSLAAAAPPGAGAAARPTIAPAPEWVAPAAIPAAPPAAEGAATVDLLTDIQRKLTNEGLRH